MSKFPSPGTLEWTRKIDRCQKPKQVVEVIQSMKPPDIYLHPNCSHEAYIVCLALASIRYTELLKKEEDEVQA